MMRGIGQKLGPPLRLPPLFCVLVNPRVPVETAAVFRQLGLQPGETLDGAAHPDIGATQPRALLESLEAARNDLEAPALALQPVIGEALARLRRTDGIRLARMSGSGATVFGLYDDCRAAVAAAKVIRRSASAWWVKSTVLR